MEDQQDYEKAQALVNSLLTEFIEKCINPIRDCLQKFIDSLEPYEKFEILHPRKKPRGSLRRLRREQRNDKRRNNRGFKTT